MHDLEITWPAGTARFKPDDSPVQIGRSFSADVPLQHPSVSRLHLELVWGDNTWTANDRSTHGTYDPIGVKLTTTWKVGTDVIVRLGGVAGEEILLRPIVGSLRMTRIPAEGEDDDTVIDLRPPPVPPSAGLGVLAGQANEAVAAQPAGPHGSLSSIDDAGSQRVLPAENLAHDSLTGVADASADSATTVFQGGQVIDPEQVDLQQDAVIDLRGNAGSGQTYEQTLSESPPALSPQRSGDQHDIENVLVGENNPPDATYGSGSALDSASGDPASGDPASTQIIVGTLRLSVDSHDYSFEPGTTVTIGRDPSCMVYIDERHSLVSRRHLQIVHRDGGWWIEDHSSKGTFVNGKRLRDPYRAEGAFVASLGDPKAGTPLRIITSGEHQAPRDYTVPIAIAAGLTVLGLLTWLVMTVLGSNEPVQNFEQAKRSSVMLLGEDSVGSGFFVADDLIVTNQHVISAEDRMFVAVTRDIDESAVIEYVAEPLELHPFLDIAVMRVVGRAEFSDGEATVIDGEAGDIGLPSVSMGSSEDMTLGDPLYSVGFPNQFWDPGAATLPSAAPVIGEATTFAIWPACDNKNWQTYIPDNAPPGVTCAPEGDGDIHRGQVVATMTTGRGASGSAVYHDGRVVAVVFAGDETPNKVLTIGATTFDEWLDNVISSN